MRIVFTSDLHADLGPDNAALVAPLARTARALRPDVFVVAGDVAETLAGVGAVLEACRDIDAKRIYVPGNHDLYVEPGAASSAWKLDVALPGVAARAGFECPHAGIVVHDGLVIAGSPGHWDYSLRDPSMDVVASLEHYRAGIWRTLRAWDRGRIQWPMPQGTWATDEEICDTLLGRLDAQLAAAAPTALLAVVHTLPFDGIFPRRSFGPSSFYDAYLGSARIGARLQREPGLRAVVTGHLHRPLDARAGAVPVVSSPVGRRRAPAADVDALARTLVRTITID